MRLIDICQLSTPRVTGCWELGDVLLDPGPTSGLERLLAGVSGRPKALLLTHIHLDHAGATGSLVERWPDLEVYVHELGAPHLVDPSRLLASARRLYGDDMDRLWGEMVPVPEANLRIVKGGEQVIDGRFEVAYTPGHASHHVSYLHKPTPIFGVRVAFVGDVGGVRIGEGSLTIAPTPPPDIDLEAWHGSIERIRAWRPDRLAIAHFGSYDDVEHQLDEVGWRLEEWAQRARDQDRAVFIDGIRDEVAGGAEANLLDAYALAAPPEQVYAGLERYWRKRAEAVPPGSPRVS